MVLGRRGWMVGIGALHLGMEMTLELADHHLEIMEGEIVRRLQGTRTTGRRSPKRMETRIVDAKEIPGVDPQISGIRLQGILFNSILLL